MATHSSVLAWRIPWAEEPGGLQSIGLQRVWTRLKRLSMHGAEQGEGTPASIRNTEDIPAASENLMGRGEERFPGRGERG